MEQWEYLTKRTHKMLTKEELNQLGKEGWELASLIQTEKPGSYGGMEFNDTFEYVFKKSLNTNIGV